MTDDTDDDDLVFDTSFAIRVFANKRGDIVITQEAPYGEPESAIIIPLDRAEAVANRIIFTATAVREREE